MLVLSAFAVRTLLDLAVSDTTLLSRRSPHLTQLFPKQRLVNIFVASNTYCTVYTVHCTVQSCTIILLLLFNGRLYTKLDSALSKTAFSLIQRRPGRAYRNTIRHSPFNIIGYLFAIRWIETYNF